MPQVPRRKVLIYGGFCKDPSILGCLDEHLQHLVFFVSILLRYSSSCIRARMPTTWGCGRWQCLCGEASQCLRQSKVWGWRARGNGGHPRGGRACEAPKARVESRGVGRVGRSRNVESSKTWGYPGKSGGCSRAAVLERSCPPVTAPWRASPGQNAAKHSIQLSTSGWQQW